MTPTHKIVGDPKRVKGTGHPKIHTGLLYSTGTCPNVHTSMGLPLHEAKRYVVLAPKYARFSNMVTFGQHFITTLEEIYLTGTLSHLVPSVRISENYLETKDPKEITF